MSNLVQFAKDELARAGLFSPGSDYDGMLGDAVLKMVEQFSEEGHSGFSAHLAIRLFEKLARFEPISPLTGEPDEWVEVYEQDGVPVYQNRRCSHVFKDGDGPAYDSTGIVFEDPDGSRVTNRDSRVPVAFPYTPTTRIVKRKAPGGES